MTLIELEVADLHPSQQAHYRRCVANGTSPHLALMLASRGAPKMHNCDRSFCEVQRYNMNHQDPETFKEVLSIAHGAGINTNGKFFVGALGSYDDPGAWVATADDVKRVADQRNYELDGVVSRRARPASSPPKDPPRLAAHIVRERVETLNQDRTGKHVAYRRIPRRNRDKLAEEVVARYGRQG